MARGERGSKAKHQSIKQWRSGLQAAIPDKSLKEIEKSAEPKKISRFRRETKDQGLRRALHGVYSENVLLRQQVADRTKAAVVLGRTASMQSKRLERLKLVERAYVREPNLMNQLSKKVMAHVADLKAAAKGS